MFKAKLIKDDRYYRLKQNGMYLIVGSIFSGFLVNFDRLPVWITITITVACLAYARYEYRKMKKFKTITDNSMLELSDDELRIVSEKKGENRAFDVRKLDGLVFQREYRLPEDTWRSMIGEYLGNYRKNYLIVEQDNEANRYDFELNSYYMITQLEKIIQDWTVKGYAVKRMNN